MRQIDQVISIPNNLIETQKSLRVCWNVNVFVQVTIWMVFSCGSFNFEKGD